MQQDKLGQYLGKMYAKSLADNNTASSYNGKEDSILATMSALSQLNQYQLISTNKMAEAVTAA